MHVNCTPTCVFTVIFSIGFSSRQDRANGPTQSQHKPAVVPSKPVAAPGTVRPAAASTQVVVPTPSSSASTRAVSDSVTPAEDQAIAAVVEDIDMFRAADQKRASVKDAPAPTKKAQLTDKAALSSVTGVKASGNKPVVKTSRVDNVQKVTTSPFASIKSDGISGMTVLGGSGSLLTKATGPKSAAQRAAEAAARVPSPEPAPSQTKKKKKVVWAAEEALVAVRWFRKVRPWFCSMHQSRCRL
jgi:hypothetical protein